jgi:hypothetical protein
VLYALSRPVALVGLVLAFLLGLVIRAVAIQVVRRRRVPAGWDVPRRRLGRVVDLKRDVDIFGAVAALLGGTGWGKKVESDSYAPPPIRTLLAGPVAVLVASQLAFLAFVLSGADPIQLRFVNASDVLRGDAPGTAVQVLLHSLAVGLLCFGLLAFVPLPPLDGWGLLRHAVKRPGPGFQKAQHWLEEQNLGVALLLLVGMLLPLFAGLPLLLYLLDLVTSPVLLLWS